MSGTTGARPDPPDGPDRAVLRAGDRDREQVADVLREACGDGRLSVAELEERLEAAYAARTHADLDILVVDLPGGSLRGLPDAGALVPAGAELTIRTGFDSERRTGRWRVPERIVVRAHIGGVKLDFTTAIVAHRRIHLDVRTEAGSCVLVVPAGWSVDTDAVRRGVGSVRNRVQAPVRPDVEVVVTGMTAVSDLVARHPRPQRWRWLVGI